MTEKTAPHLVVETGREQGRRLAVPATGARIGRSSANDIVIADTSLSRFHCRFFFKPDGTLWVCDLGSTNTTAVNGRPIQETALQAGDVIEIGAVRLRVLDPAEGQALPDLGLGPASRGPRPRGVLLWLGLVLAAGLGFLALLFGPIRPRAPAVRPAASADLPALAFEYEKVEASSDNIFRYHVVLEEQRLRVRIHDLKDGRDVAREKDLDTETIARLAQDLDRGAVFELQPAYEGLARDLWHEARLTVTVGRRTHSSRVLNRLEPELFRRARERIEDFVRHELGLAALALPPDRLRELGYEAFLRGRRLFDERQVHPGNLAAAISAFREAIWYTEELEPKPEFFAAAVSGEKESERLLEERVEELSFRAERAINLRDWPAAARHLRLICEWVPDRTDRRHEEARRKLLDVERRMNR